MNIERMNYPFDKGLKNLITKKGLKQTYVAEQAGISVQTLSDMLNGRRLIKIYEMPKLSIAIGETINDIYEAGKAFESSNTELH